MKYSNDEDFEDDVDSDQEGKRVDEEEVIAKRKKIEEAV